MHFKSLGNWSIRFLLVQKNPQNTWHPQGYKLILWNFNSHFTVVSILPYCVFYQVHPQGHLLQFWALLSSCQRSNSWSEKENQHIPMQTYNPLQNSLNLLLCRSTVQFHCISHKLCLFQKLVINYVQIWELELKKWKPQALLSILRAEIL